MENNEQIRKSLLEMTHGAILERFDYEMSKVIDNILDENTKATAARTLTLKIKLVPDDERRTIDTSATATCSLAATNPVKTALYIAGVEDGIPAVVEMVPQIPGQRALGGVEQDEPAKLRLIKMA